MAQTEIDAYLETVVRAAEHSGGVVSNDTDLLSMSPWRGTPIIEPTAFAAKVDAMRRHARRRR